MENLVVEPGPALHGLGTIVIENRLVRIIVLPEAGDKVWQIHYKPLHADILWNQPELHPSRHALHTSYDETWSGGWDELFPNDEAGELTGQSLPDHGELWTGTWQAESFRCNDTVGAHLNFTTPISNFLAEKTLLLRPDSAVLEVHYKLTNQGSSTFPFLWKLHPAFAVSANHRIDFPAMTVVREPEFPGTLDGAPLTFQWPDATLRNTMLDLRQVPDASSRAVHFFYGTELASGWCGVTNRTNKLAAALQFNPEVFSSCWLFATHGGWRELDVAGFWPPPSYPFKKQTLVGNCTGRRPAAGEEP